MAENNMAAERPIGTPTDIGEGQTIAGVYPPSGPSGDQEPQAAPAPHEGPFDLLGRNVFPADIKTHRSGRLRQLADTALGVLGARPEDKGQATILAAHTSYTAVLRARGASEEELKAAHARFSRDLTIYENSPSKVFRNMRAEKASRELDLLLRSSFDLDTSLLRSLGHSSDVAEQREKLFVRASRRTREAIVIQLQADVQRALIQAFPRLVLVWKDMNPDGVNLDALQEKFAGESEESKFRRARKLFSDIETSIDGRFQTARETLRELLIDDGMSPEEAEHESLFEVSHDTHLPPEAKLTRLRELEQRIDGLVLEHVDDNVELWAQMNGDRKDIGDSWRRTVSASSEAGRKRLARKLYRKIQKKMGLMTRDHLSAIERILKDSGMDTPDVNAAVSTREVELLGMSKAKQLEAVNSL